MPNLQKKAQLRHGLHCQREASVCMSVDSAQAKQFKDPAKEITVTGGSQALNLTSLHTSPAPHDLGKSTFVSL